MAIRNSNKSNLRFGRLRERIRSTLFGRSDHGEDDAEPDQSASSTQSRPDAPGNLFQCATCGTVYIDSKKSRCTDCDEDVEQVRADLEPALVR